MGIKKLDLSSWLSTHGMTSFDVDAEMLEIAEAKGYTQYDLECGCPHTFSFCSETVDFTHDCKQCWERELGLG